MCPVDITCAMPHLGYPLYLGEVLIQPHTGRLEVASHSMTCDTRDRPGAFMPVQHLKD